MALQGSLSDFGIAEILQLLSTQQKTGVLYVSLAELEISISFISGKIVACQSNGDNNVDLPMILSKANLLTKEQFSYIKKTSKNNNADEFQIITEMKVISADELVRIENLYTEELICSLFSWKEGKYQFDTLLPNDIYRDIEPISPQNVLMEGYRRLDEWPLIRAKVNNYGIVYHAIKDVGDLENDAQALERLLDDAFSEFAEAPAGPPKKQAIGSAANLGAHERVLLKLIDGKVTVEALVNRSLLGEFETCKALFTLQNEGFIEPLKVKRSKAVPGRARVANQTALAIAVNALILASLVGIILLIPQSKSEFQLNSKEVMNNVTRRLKNNRKTAIISALEVYRIEHGDYPESLSLLLEEGLIDESLLVRGSKQISWRYTSIGDDYDLR
ncbi:DUF4388 domain-containing protein [Myxococcota bacterium]|nr:DUF4388 domain-containing protein [Myxococcota bacterium]